MIIVTANVGLLPFEIGKTRRLYPRKDKRGFDLISDVLPFGRLWYAGRKQ
jgi:hypothetical protein